MKTYRHLFFDLDHTLWDFVTNSKEAINELYVTHDLAGRNISSAQRFYEVYVEVNDRMWALYRAGKMGKKTLRKMRFLNTFQRFGIEDETLGTTFGEDYVALSPYKTALFEGCHELLSYCRDKGYEMHIITNGFEEVQHVKLRESRLTQYFTHIITSEAVQARKPNPLIFEHAFKTTGACAEDSLMIGDNMDADILGAMNMGMDAVFFNPEKKAHTETVTYEIAALKEMENIV